MLDVLVALVTPLPGLAMPRVQREATLRQVVQRYPGSDVARTADDRLRAMQISGAR